MIFYHAAVHRQLWRELVALSGGTGALEPVLIECPNCGARYLADLPPDVEPPGFDELVWEAEELLRAECADHPHWFDPWQ